jgi:hypothetical protein
MISAAVKVALFVAFVCGLLSLCEQSLPSSPSVILGDLSYNMASLKAPILTGAPLTAFTYIATKSPLGFVLRRFLLLDNGMTQLRELAAQMPETPPLHHPMMRMTKEQKLTHEEKVRAAAAAGITMDELAVWGSPQFTAESSEVMALHEAFKSKASSPSKVANKILAAFPTIQEKFRCFSTYPLLGDIEKAAAASTERFAAGKPLSIWDGVPVAFKDMIPVAGYVMTDGSAANQAAGVNRTKDDLLVERFRELGAVVLPPTSMTEGGVTPVGYSTYIKGALNPYGARESGAGARAREKSERACDAGARAKWARVRSGRACEAGARAKRVQRRCSSMAKAHVLRRTCARPHPT